MTGVARRTARCIGTVAAGLALLALPAFAAGEHGGHGSHGDGNHGGANQGGGAQRAAPSPYAGQETRAIKSLSPEDIAEIRRGGGWGLAKAAELNGLPGPAHVLELGEDLALTPGQTQAIADIHARMQQAAIAERNRLIAREAALEASFRAREVDQESLSALLTAIGESRTELRRIHLAAHLETTPLLSEDQLARYGELRGYPSLR